MLRKRWFRLISILVLFTYSADAQVKDTTSLSLQEIKNFNLDLKIARPAESKKITLKSFYVPAGLITYGIVSLESHDLTKLNYKVREEIYLESPHKKLRVDDYLQYAPAVAVYGLNLAGIKGLNNFRDRSIIYLMSDIILNASVSWGKKTSRQLRPDESNYLSFPSGHTAHAFASAEFLRREYRHISPWYGYAGYAVAATTGYLRMYNNRHWLSDVAAGAGVGIASMRIAYWLYPKVKKIFFNKSKSDNIIIPSYSDGSIGLNFVRQF
ncbi:MAG: phosphatase PAP2 family protein [Chitinophagaceae bacterium]|nr:MAG: phosphatase PAP2 family protein [Chitinophagaceae bacterium]